MLKRYEIYSRRYIGSKLKMANMITNFIAQSDKGHVADLFAGTGTITSYLIDKNFRVVVNDTLYSNYICYEAFFGNRKVSVCKIEKIINSFNKEVFFKDNYFSESFGGKYFSAGVARKIGWIRERIKAMLESKTINLDESYILIASLMYSMDRVANTVGHYEMYLSKIPVHEEFEMGLVSLRQRGRGVVILNCDAVAAVEQLKKMNLYVQAAYLDPPYNARQYINFYHVWENVARWEKPILSTISRKFYRESLKSKYSRSEAPEELKNLILSLVSVPKIIVSYNNTYLAKSTASINKISEKQMIEILSINNRLVSALSINYKPFNSGKTTLVGHKELLFFSNINHN